jgi:hypothetical protein
MSATLSEGALNETARALADRGEDYGWNVYRRGNRVNPRALDEGAEHWLEAFRAAVRAYKQATGEDWRY